MSSSAPRSAAVSPELRLLAVLNQEMSVHKHMHGVRVRLRFINLVEAAGLCASEEEEDEQPGSSDGYKMLISSTDKKRDGCKDTLNLP
jgi:hypothetical protein